MGRIACAFIGIPLSAVLGSPYLAGTKVGEIRDPRIAECSGIAACWTQPDVCWVHNDSGDRPRIFAITKKGNVVAEVAVKGARAIDWEDIAVGPGPGGKPWIYIGDVGNNAGARRVLSIYRIPEPTLPKAPEGPPARGRLESGDAEEIRFRYPDGPHDAEAIFVHPTSGRIFVVTKVWARPVHVYGVPPERNGGEVVTLEKVAVLRFASVNPLERVVTGADISRDGHRVVVRSYLAAHEYALEPGEAFPAMFSRAPARIRLPAERLGEAITYWGSGGSIVTTSEGVPAPIHEIRRAK